MSAGKDDAADVLKLVAAAGLPGFRSSKPENEEGSAPTPPPSNDNHVDMLARLVGIKPAAEQQASGPDAESTDSSAPAARLSGREYIMLRIGDADARQALSRFETAHGPIGADSIAGAHWFGQQFGDGSEIRVFDVPGYSPLSLSAAKGIVGPLCGCPSLRLEVAKVDMAGLQPSGPGARDRRVGMPQLSFASFERLKMAAGR